MEFTATFILLYLVSIALGRKVRMPSVISDAVVLALIFTISYWGGVEVSSQAVAKIAYLSLVSSVVVVVVTYFIGSLVKLEVKEGKAKVDLLTQLKYLLPLVIGIVLGTALKFSLPFDQIIDWELYLLAVVIGISVGRELSVEVLRRITGLAVFSILVAVAGAVVSSVFLYFLGIKPFNLALAISLGSGWYSYTGPVVAKFYGPVYGVIGFLVNFLREQLTFSLVPVFLKLRSSPLGAIAVGGATSMDTTLGFYVEVLGAEYGVGAMINGVILTLVVPVVLPLVLSA
ncbi:MAG: lysine exporter LysO family protein [Candidatus Aramenus sulfurataquae]|uniref:Lysine exporter LysO family protein n=2 Tax=Candidatus Aramenus sulfurataquae TaxID=1326980 RepID=A0A0F2LL70_9CREN|nr:lysine exporter LysO family protein [Candidatus Aramenus sulfurataquae]